MERPEQLRGDTYRIRTPDGTLFATVNGDEPIEVILRLGKTGSDGFAMTEALGRIISAFLQMDKMPSRPQRLRVIADQLSGIGGERHLGFGPDRVHSVADGIAHALRAHLDRKEDNWAETTPLSEEGASEIPPSPASGDVEYAKAH